MSSQLKVWEAVQSGLRCHLAASEQACVLMLHVPLCYDMEALSKRVSLHGASRQGEMARWVTGSGRWTDCHFVLTRRGFLHWFGSSPPAPAEVVPADTLNLSRWVLPAVLPQRWLVLLAGHKRRKDVEYTRQSWPGV